MSSIRVVIPTLGRPEVVSRALHFLQVQTRIPDEIIISCTNEEDLAITNNTNLNIKVLIGDKGLCKQRNRALKYCLGRTDYLVFFDDDFIAERHYIARVERLFDESKDLVGCTGRMLADGVLTGGLSFDAAHQYLSAESSAYSDTNEYRKSLYGCNMSFRVSALGKDVFDESLPLYGWLEDIDFSYRVGSRGRMGKFHCLSGVHLGIQKGRVSGKRLGYSQIVNPAYLIRKRSAPLELCLRLIARNFISNAVRSINPEREIDRRGRLIGNLLGILDVLRGRFTPDRILKF